MKRSRFAPSPTGYLHLGHAYSAWKCWNWAEEQGGECVLRIEDIDHTRCRAPYVDAILEDLSWLGLEWKEPILFQSKNQDRYDAALQKLRKLGVLYPCSCSRKDIEKALSAPHIEDRSIYPGTCRGKNLDQLEEPHNLRLDIEKSLQITGPLVWTDELSGEQKVDLSNLGDIVIARKDIGTSYHLSVVVDDAQQEIDTVVRGQDLFEVTHIHRLLQALLELPTPGYLHHPLLLDHAGQRLAKRRGGNLVRTLREEGCEAADVFHQIELLTKDNTYA